MRQVEDLHLRSDLELFHSGCKVEHQPRSVLVHNRGKIGGTGRERSHVRFMGERETAPSRVASPASCRELYDHARAMLAHARLHSANRSGSEEEDSSSLRTWIWTKAAP